MKEFILEQILIAASKAGVLPQIMIAICTVESNLINKNVYNDNGSPSYGICQVKLNTARWMGKLYSIDRLKNITDKELNNVYLNALSASLYIKYNLSRYNNDYCKAVAAYNAGSFRLSSSGSGLPFNYTYVRKVKNQLNILIAKKLSCNPNRQFFVLN